MSDSQQLVQKLWNYCNILRDDGLSYGDYVEQFDPARCGTVPENGGRAVPLTAANKKARMLPERLSPRRHGDDFQ